MWTTVAKCDKLRKGSNVTLPQLLPLNPIAVEGERSTPKLWICSFERREGRSETPSKTDSTLLQSLSPISLSCISVLSGFNFSLFPFSNQLSSLNNV